MHLPQSTAHSADLWTPEQTSLELNVSLRTLAAWHSTGRRNVPYVKVGRLVRYRQPDVSDWLQGRLHAPAQSGGFRDVGLFKPNRCKRCTHKVAALES